MTTIRRAGEQDLPAILNVVDSALKSLSDPTLFLSDGPDFYREHLKDKGFTLLAEIDGAAAAYLAVRFPGLEDDNLMRDLGFPEQELPKAAHMESVAVLPQCRGNGLQKKLIAEAEKQLPGTIRFSLATVSPQNPGSQKSFLGLGYTVEKTVKKYGGLDRYILLKKL